MINIQIASNHKGQIQSLEVSGHAGFAEAGEDIVCAAVSSQLISIENSLQALLEIPVTSQVDEIEGGYLKLDIAETGEKRRDQDGQLLLRHLVFALDVLAENYPEYIKIKQFQK
ncbi:ribosomal-processing cysteine protease Prp [Eremococcus coleocola]|uniref:Ribosomal processing cysteine protease Prp n=1 Tax=Eremococcus coleocola ACS-139-V-Col8 TaxID=908337 RepID=E4KP37_9LACT|nr:ribosomal-processing cysteine protease Prp [Eremococcus coleocola]EFR31362.1 hypothetical protein HMPREF9257_1321 [Eremococcus coleocola ACS-139-V-Col8]